MEFSMSQQQALQLKLAITPSMRQSLDILSYGMSDLLSYIQQQADMNPLMEIENPRIEESSIELAKMHSEDYTQTSETYEGIVQATQTMEQFLLEQVLAASRVSVVQQKLLVYFIHHLNDAGYLVCDIEEVAEEYEMPFEDAYAALKILQSFEPAGIGARSLAECLYLQLREKKQIPEYTEEIILHHLDAVAARNFSELGTIYACSEAHIEQVLQFIQTLNPRPVFDVHTEETQYIVPDLILEIIDGVGVLQVNDRFLPHISVSTAYDDLMREHDEVAQFMKGKISEILLLKKGIEQRYLTVYKVAQAILHAQPHFIHEGKKGLLPLRLKEIAEQTGFHESTISRTINQKYIQTPYGVLLLKEFFIRGLLNEQGMNQNIQFIQQQLRKLIEKEDKVNPYSDQQLVQLLEDEEIIIARRTVAKYREQLHIPSSSKRRHKKREQ